MVHPTLLQDSPLLETVEPCPLPSLLPGISDSHLLLVIPILVHWLTSACFEIIERCGWFEEYRLHTSAEELLKNKVTRRDCFINTVRCQFLQTLLGVVLTWNEQVEMSRDDDHDIAVWSRRVHVAFAAAPKIMSLSGIDFTSMTLPDITLPLLSKARMTSLDLEALAGRLLYWYVVPSAQLIWALIVADAWMYFLHRLGHTNKWMYKHVHSHHHRLYVPYSWGGSYGHIFDNVVVDGLAYSVACWAGGLSNRLAMILFAYSSYKNIADHSGYVLPWDPIRKATGTNADFHDVHHQVWGLKTNFGLHFTIWDRLMGTYFDDKDKIAKNRMRSRLV